MREPDLERAHPVGMGIQKLYRFANGYGASVIMFKIEFPKLPELEHFEEHLREHPVGSYGVGHDLWELAVIRFTGPEIENFTLDTDTFLTNDVLDYLTDDEVDTWLDRIEALPANVGETSTKES